MIKSILYFVFLQILNLPSTAWTVVQSSSSPLASSSTLASMLRRSHQCHQRRQNTQPKSSLAKHQFHSLLKSTTEDNETSSQENKNIGIDRNEAKTEESQEGFSDKAIPIVDRDAHLKILDDNLRQWTDGRGLFQHMYRELYTEDEQYHEWDDVHMSTRFALLSHGSTEGIDGPVNNYANFGACGVFEIPRGLLLTIPAICTVGPGWNQDELASTLNRLRERNRNDDGQIIKKYSGWRCTLPDQRRFFVRDGLLWNCYDENGDYYGQALLFDREKIVYDEDRTPGEGFFEEEDT